MRLIPIDDPPDVIAKASELSGLHPRIIDQLIQHESGGDPNATSPTGPQGLMQLSKAAAIDVGLDPNQRYNPDLNAQAGSVYYKQGLDRFGPNLAYAAYHDGHQAVQDFIDGKRQLSPEAVRGTKKFADLHRQTTTASLRLIPLDEPTAEQDAPPTEWAGSTDTIPQQNTPWSQVGKSMARNLFPSIGNQIIGTGKAIWDAPETIATLADLPNSLKAIGQSYIDKYGSLEGFKQSLANDPASILSDLALAIPTGTKLTPTLDVLPKAEELLKAGVELTPGRMSGGFLRTLEDKLTSLPFTGYQINKRTGEALAGFNTNEVDKALSPIGKTIPRGLEAGNETINNAYTQLSSVYQDALKDVSIKLKPQQLKAIEQTGARVALPPSYFNKFNSELTNVLHPLKGGTISGSTYKEVISNLNDRIRQYNNSPEPLDDYVANHLVKVKENLNNSLGRPGVFNKAGMTDPTETLSKLKAADTAFARMVPIEKSAAAPGNQHGVFSANTLLRKSVGGPSNMRAAATGTGFNQQSLMNAQDILPSKIPDSGTPGRLAAMGLLTGITSGAWMNPAYLAPAGIDAIGALLGTRFAQKHIVKPMLFNGLRMTPAEKALIAASKLRQDKK